MTTDRPYRAALAAGGRIAELRACSGTQFDPRVVDALIAVLGAGGETQVDARRRPPGRRPQAASLRPQSELDAT